MVCTLRAPAALTSPSWSVCGCGMKAANRAHARVAPMASAGSPTRGPKLRSRAASIDQSGIVSIAAHIPDYDPDPQTLLEMETRFETISILIIHIMKLCISDYNAAVGMLSRFVQDSDEDANAEICYAVPRHSSNEN